MEHSHASAYAPILHVRRHLDGFRAHDSNVSLVSVRGHLRATFTSNTQSLQENTAVTASVAVNTPASLLQLSPEGVHRPQIYTPVRVHTCTPNGGLSSLDVPAYTRMHTHADSRISIQEHSHTHTHDAQTYTLQVHAHLHGHELHLRTRDAHTTRTGSHIRARVHTDKGITYARDCTPPQNYTHRLTVCPLEATSPIEHAMTHTSERLHP